MRKCGYCGSSIEHRPLDAEYCNRTHQQYAYLVRQGKKQPFSSSSSEGEENQTSPEKVKALKNRLDELDIELKNKERALEQLVTQLQQLKPQQNLYRLRKKVEGIEQSLNNSLSEGAIIVLNEEREKMLVEIENGKKENEKISAARKQLEYKIAQQNLAIFRALEKRNDFALEHFFNTKEVSGNQIEELKKYSTVYSFEHWESRYLACLGNPPQPFFVSISGGRESGKTLLSFLFCDDLLRLLDTPILYVSNVENKKSVLDYVGRMKSSNEKLTLLFPENLIEIKSTLGSKNFEFLFIDTVDSFKINATVLKQLNKDFPKLNIFLLSRKTARRHFNLVHFNITTEKYLSFEHGLRLEGANFQIKDYDGKEPASEEIDYDGNIFFIDFEGKFCCDLKERAEIKSW